MKPLLLFTWLLLSTAPPALAGWRDSLPTDTTTATFGDPSLYIDETEKPLWFFLDSLSRADGWRKVVPASGERTPKISTTNRLVGLLEGFELARVDYVIQYSKEPKADSLQSGTLFLMEIWPSLFHLITHFSRIDSPDSAAIIYFPNQEALSLRWRSETDSTAWEWEQLWAWHRLDGRPVNLKFAQLTQRTLDETLPPGCYAPFAGRLDDSTLCLTAPVYRPTDQFGDPTGGDVTLCYRIENLTLSIESSKYTPKK